MFLNTKNAKWSRSRTVSAVSVRDVRADRRRAAADGTARVTQPTIDIDIETPAANPSNPQTVRPEPVEGALRYCDCVVGPNRFALSLSKGPQAHRCKALPRSETNLPTVDHEPFDTRSTRLSTPRRRATEPFDKLRANG